MKTSLNNFKTNFQPLNDKQLNKIVGGNNTMTIYSVGKRRGRIGGVGNG